MSEECYSQVMIAFSPGTTEIAIVCVVVAVLFGGAKIPKFARSLGQAQKEFKKGLEEGTKEDGASKSE